MMTHRQVGVSRGYANHETLHKLLTDFNVGQAWMHDMTQKGLEFTKSMAQGLEDVRIENGRRILYNGIARSVDKTAEQVCREFKKDCRQGTGHLQRPLESSTGCSDVDW